MRMGILADIHEPIDDLWRVLAVLEEHGADRLVVLGDVCGRGPDSPSTGLVPGRSPTPPKRTPGPPGSSPGRRPT
jgi:Calcineurin-like phosphoesterase